MKLGHLPVPRHRQAAKKYYDEKVLYAFLEGDRVLVRMIGIQGEHKLADLWKADAYIIWSQPIPDIPWLYFDIL